MSTIHHPLRIRGNGRTRLLDHFLSLDADDRRRRFAAQTSDAGLQHYVDSIDFDRDCVFVVENDELDIIGAAHLSTEEDQSHIGLSVSSDWCEQGVASALLWRCLLRARNSGVVNVHMTSFHENTPMSFLEKKFGFVIAPTGADADAERHLANPNVCSLIAEGFDDWLAEVDHDKKVRREKIRQKLAMRIQGD